MNPLRVVSAFLVAAGLFTAPALAADPVQTLVRDRAQAIAQVQASHLDALAAMARMPVVADYFRAGEKDRPSRLRDVQAALAGRQMGSELCLIDHHGSEHLRAVKGRMAPQSELAHNEVDAPFFHDGIHLPAGQSLVSAPYASPDVDEWVLAYVVPVIPGQAILHYEHPLKEIQGLATQGVEGADRFLLVVDEQGLIFGDSRRRVHLTTTGDSADPSANFQNLVNSEPKLPPALVAEIVSEPERSTKAAWNGGSWDVAWKRIGSLILVGFQRQS